MLSLYGVLCNAIQFYGVFILLYKLHLYRV